MTDRKPTDVYKKSGLQRQHSSRDRVAYGLWQIVPPSLTGLCPRVVYDPDTGVHAYDEHLREEWRLR